MQKIIFKDLGFMSYQAAWDYQEALLRENVRIKSEVRRRAEGLSFSSDDVLNTTHYLLLVEHPPVYTLGKSGHIENVLMEQEDMEQQGIQFFRTNRGGDITFHGPGQIVGYPILDLEKFKTDIGWYLRSLEEVAIAVLAEYGLQGKRSSGETGVWLEPGIVGKERKICAIGVRCSRWITMHGFAFNVNTDLSYFKNIVPCGIQDKQVTSLERELGHPVPIEDVKTIWRTEFANVFGVELTSADSTPADAVKAG